MRLIDADEMLANESEAYMKAQEKCDALTEKVNKVVHMKIQRLIQDTPTAYNLGEVMKQLEREKSDLTDWEEDIAYGVAIEKAIKIVKEGEVIMSEKNNGVTANELANIIADLIMDEKDAVKKAIKEDDRELLKDTLYEDFASIM